MCSTTFFCDRDNAWTPYATTVSCEWKMLSFLYFLYGHSPRTRKYSYIFLRRYYGRTCKSITIYAHKNQNLTIRTDDIDYIPVPWLKNIIEVQIRNSIYLFRCKRLLYGLGILLARLAFEISYLYMQETIPCENSHPTFYFETVEVYYTKSQS